MQPYYSAIYANAINSSYGVKQGCQIRGPQEKFNEVGVPEFYKYLPARFENMRKFAYEIISVFGNTFQCKKFYNYERK